MKIEDPRVTHYTLGELPADAREEFEKELALSDELQRELQDTAIVCEKLIALPPTEQGFDERTRANLREECLRNLRIVRRGQHFRRAALAGAVGALAACFLLAPFVPWKAVLLQWPMRETSHGTAGVVASVPQAKPAPAPGDSQASASQLLASAESIPAPGLPNTQDPAAAAPMAHPRLDRQTVASTPSAAASAPGAPPARTALAASQSSSKAGEFSMAGSGRGLGSGMGPDKAGEARRFKRAADEEFNTEAYDGIEENRFRDVRDNPLSTFSIDVDTASYANVRRFLRSDRAAAADAVRIEELVNYFAYDYPRPKAGDPFAVNVEVGACPVECRASAGPRRPQGPRDVHAPNGRRATWCSCRRLRLDGRRQAAAARSARFDALVEKLRRERPRGDRRLRGRVGPRAALDTAERTRIGFSRRSTSCKPAARPNGGAGIQLAYQTARQNFIKGRHQPRDPLHRRRF